MAIKENIEKCLAKVGSDENFRVQFEFTDGFTAVFKARSSNFAVTLDYLWGEEPTIKTITTSMTTVQAKEYAALIQVVSDVASQYEKISEE